VDYYRSHKDQLAEAVVVCLEQRVTSQHLDLCFRIGIPPMLFAFGGKTNSMDKLATKQQVLE